jgi:phosphatidate cytidylyltransferase
MTRIVSALVLIPVIVWDVLWAPQWVFLAILMIVGGLAYYEFDSIAAHHPIPRRGWPGGPWTGIAAGLLLLIVPEPAMGAVAVVWIGLMLAALRVNDLANALPSAATALLGVLYIFGAWRCAILLRELNPHWLMVALLVSWAGDTAAYYVGRKFGRRKLAPVISPSKSWEGAAGSLAGGIAAALIYTWFLIPIAPVWATLLIAAAGNVAGQAGDLAESALKRGARVKDSGTLLPGHGGWLDRIDSSLFSIPAVYLVLRSL